MNNEETSGLDKAFNIVEDTAEVIPKTNKLAVRRAQNGTKAAAAASGTPVDIINVDDDNLLTGGDDFGFSETVSYYE